MRPAHYQVRIQPTGTWEVHRIDVDGGMTKVANGVVVCPSESDRMEVAERDARAWIAHRKKEARQREEYEQRCKTFTLPT